MPEAISLRRHLIDELRDLLDAEQQLTRALPKFAEAAATPPLKQAFQKHLKETERHLDRLGQALAALGEAPRAKPCVGMRGLLAEGNQMVGSSPKGALRDAIMISAAQKVEHYEMAAYGTARTYAEVLGRADVARLLDDSLQEEKAADQKLTKLILSIDNPAGPKAYNVDKDADVTVVLYVDRKVKANFAFKKGELKDGDIEKIMKDVPKILSD